MPIPRSSIDSIVAANWGLVGVSASTSTAAYLRQSIISDAANAITYRLPVEGPDKSVAIAIFCSRDGGFRLDHRVDTTNCVPVNTRILRWLHLAYLDWQPQSLSRRGSGSECPYCLATLCNWVLLLRLSLILDGGSRGWRRGCCSSRRIPTKTTRISRMAGRTSFKKQDHGIRNGLLDWLAGALTS